MAPLRVALLALIGGSLSALAEIAAGAPPAAASAAGQPSQPPAATAAGGIAALGATPSLRSGRELLEAVREALPRLAAPDDSQAEEAARELLVLYNELERDTAMAGVQRDYYKAKVRSRLQALSDQISKRIARNRRLAGPPARKSILEKGAAGDHLAQRLARRGPPAAPMPPPAAPPRRAAAPGDDYGAELVELIQKTIAPASWDVNGGLGAIHYWRPGRALVVRQTDAVHEEVGDVLRQLERASR
ncbi:MAG: hypothetical protein ACOX1P_23490 [Thermoguttaceae bacterium]|jgi:hypothetical protein